VIIPAGANILLALGSANYDEVIFPEPERFDIRRANAREHLSFGKGAHFCIGAPLARLELKVLLEELTARYPSLTLIEGQQVDYIRTIAFRGPKHLKARL
jgi:cytochrome P450